MDMGCRLLPEDCGPVKPRAPESIGDIGGQPGSWYFLLPDFSEPEFMRDRYGNWYLQTEGAAVTRLIETGFSRLRAAGDK